MDIQTSSAVFWTCLKAVSIWLLSVLLAIPEAVFSQVVSMQVKRLCPSSAWLILIGYLHRGVVNRLSSPLSGSQRQRHLHELCAVSNVQSDAPKDPLSHDLPGLLPDSSGHHLGVLLPHRSNAHEERPRHAG